MSNYRSTNEITEIILHCSATEAEGRDITAQEIDKWHKAQGYVCIGYHYYVRKDGTIEYGRALDQMGAHCKGHNRQSIGICYEGGLSNGKPADTRTEKQKDATVVLVMTLIGCLPNIRSVHGHCEFAAKSCPCFDVQKEFGELNEALANREKK